MLHAVPVDSMDVIVINMTENGEVKKQKQTKQKKMFLLYKVSHSRYSESVSADASQLCLWMNSR